MSRSIRFFHILFLDGLFGSSMDSEGISGVSARVADMHTSSDVVAWQ